MADTSSCAADDSTRVASTRKSKKSRAATGTELRRQRNREHQARYKTKQKNRVLDLENGIERLQQEIQELKLQRQIISIGVPGRQTKWGVAAEYFRLFRNGLRAPSRMNLPVGTVAAEFPVQRHFLQTTMTSDVVGSLGCGVDALLQNWRLITLCHPDVDIQLMRLQAGPGERVVAYTRGTHTITEDTLRYAFPHLNDGSNDSAWLASRLLGYKLVINGCTHLLWDADAGRMISIQYTADILTPMLQLLGNLDEVSKLFSKARVNPQCRFCGMSLAIFAGRISKGFRAGNHCCRMQTIPFEQTLYMLFHLSIRFVFSSQD
ncbi:hypothetical protein PHYSODRAFT_469671 [Phytophthora sojae]|uniref:BZIP domain-containing protein n=1 Tax=Phytophthora sojae (strain P6497) TaxID=1094619 RepID=G4YFV7_PHYSP|nr:hypothetical protein PHYSODRAFT_469671 [Phytophthora sojae]EGZ27683.1 hypothetical protein PHYSODRAFT_469671 [Phytophthora sojae]|eukprot:XP_009514958.1 hypothetical protein PHYSODRAFT_469671 [Phytophthora sojae]